MMVGKNGEELPESGGGGGGEDFMKLLRSLERDEILEILSDGFCRHCQDELKNRILILIKEKVGKLTLSNGHSSPELCLLENSRELSTWRSNQQDSSPIQTRESGYLKQSKGSVIDDSLPASVNSKSRLSDSGFEMLLDDGLGGTSPPVDIGLSEEQKEQIRFLQVRKKEFSYIENINGKSINVVQGLELHTRVFNAKEQKHIVECVYELQHLGQKGRLRERTYSEPRKWMRGKGRVTIQYGCCYNYAVDKNGNPPGIIRVEEVDPLPPLFKKMIKRMVRWHILPPTCVPNSCIVNIYDEGDCIPPHIDHHDFVRPFCTVSFLTECNILFGSNLKILGPGEFSGPVSIPLPLGSVLILNGNGADIAEHCVPGVPGTRISITFRKMDNTKLPYKFSPDPDLLGIKPIISRALTNKSPININQHKQPNANSPSSVQQRGQPVAVRAEKSNGFLIEDNDFPTLRSSNSLKQTSVRKSKWGH